MTATMGRKPKSLEKEWVPMTPFQEWLDDALERKGWDLKRLAEVVGADYSNLWRVARGNPKSYPGRNRVNVETVTAIGVTLGDLPGALKSCNYPAHLAVPALAASAPEPDALATLDEVQSPDKLLKEFLELTAEERVMIFGAMTGLRKARHRSAPT